MGASGGIYVPQVAELVSMYYRTKPRFRDIKKLILKRIAALMVKFAGELFGDHELMDHLCFTYPPLCKCVYFKEYMLAFLLVQRNSLISLGRFHLE